jgi:hypothetical protein
VAQPRRIERLPELAFFTGFLSAVFQPLRFQP